ncbi:hypothetical protein NHX12_000516 [Muraenolepis orangiensis]|uniref:Eukaryotic translation initiation factor 4 gamma 1-like n=1 Tax=Muraenolepis orangiensis TaxID=630683 RepID=A0A9Q0D8U8_9TELE|nr:hypothetical protein NHX12_000516 [Muraenolepis orangiensis]
MTDDRGSRERARSKENAPAVKRPSTPTPPPAQTITKPTLTEEQVEKQSTAIVEEYVHINDMKEALLCVQEMSSSQLLFVFVRSGLEATLERSAVARERMGLLLHQLVLTSTLPTQQYYKGLQEIMEVAKDMSIDVPHIWQYLAEQIAPMLHEGGIPMGPLFREITKPLVPQGQASVLLVQILLNLCQAMSHKKNVEFTLGQESETGQGGKMALSPAELSQHLGRLLKDKADKQRILDWVEANLDEQQMSSNAFVRALMTCVCQSAIVYDNPHKVEAKQIGGLATVLQKYLNTEQKELQALYALQALMVELEQPANLLRMFFDALYDEDVIKEEAFEKWGSSKDPAEQQGKGVALKSVTTFFTWLREADIESDNS